MLLHGLGATGDYFGAAYDHLGADHRVLVPDLLGFGRSLDEARPSFGLTDHLDALDTMLADHAPRAEEVVVVAHSMGSVLALAWAARHPHRINRVACFGAPVYANPEAATAGVAESGPMARIFLLDTAWARRVCALNCAHRTLAGAFASLAAPSLPVPVTRRSSLHTWPAYRDALDELILHADWAGLLGTLDAQATPVTLAWGDQDRIGDVDHAGSIIHPGCQSVEIVPGAAHHLPITHPGAVLDHLG